MEKTPNTDPAPPLANPMAVASLVLGISSVGLFMLFAVALDSSRFRDAFIGYVFVLPLFWLASIPAIIVGHSALRKIGRIFHPVKGRDIARAGLILGYLMTFVAPVAGSLMGPLGTNISGKGNISKAISNCRQIITTLRLYSSDNGGNYPDAVNPKVRTSNEAFHMMFVGGQADNEMIFGAPLSPYQPDGNIGKAPDYLEALKPGENHWAMTRGLNDSAPGTYPLVFENPADATWPPKWDTNAVSVPKPGRVWKNGKIIIGMNDSSVALQKLEPDQGGLVGLKPLATGDSATLFSQNDPAKDGLKIGILDIAR
jgi:Domain of unknown function (DUF4190)